MKSTLVGFAYPLWLRMRWEVAAALAYLAVLTAAAPLLRPAPPNADTASVVVRALTQTPLMAILAAAPLLYVMARLLAASTYSSADLTARRDGFPSHMLVLPVPTRALVGWPMLFGGAAVALGWVLLAGLFLNRAGLHVRLLWPAAMTWTLTAWLQAIDWWPFRVPLGRAVCATLALVAIGGLAAWAAGAGVSSTAIALGFAVATIGAYAVARYGVSLARRGDQPLALSKLMRFLGHLRTQSDTGHQSKPRFRSASAAQFWLECRRNALLMPAVCAASFAPMLLPLASGPRPARAPLLISGYPLSPIMLILVCFAAALPFLGAALSGALGKFDVFSKDIRIPPFLATRPLSTGSFVAAKLKAAAFSTLLGWLALLFVLLIGQGVGFVRFPSRPSIFRLLREHSSPRELALIATAFVLLSLLTWRNQVVGLYVTLTGRRWVSQTLGGVFALFWLVLLIGGAYVYQLHGRTPRFITLLPKLLPALIALKATTAAIALALLLRRRLIRPQVLALWVVGWAAVTGTCLLLLSRFITLPLAVIEWVILLVPFTRIALAPLALHANRHR